MTQLELIADERDEIPDHIVVDEATIRRWSAHRYSDRPAGIEEEGLADWHTLAEIVDALARFGGAHAQKKRDTVIALVEAELAGEPEETVFKRPDTCSRSTYHHRWKKNKQFTRILALARDIARKYHSAQQAAAMLEARRTMQLGSAPAARVMVDTLQDDDSRVALSAARAIIEIVGLFNDEKPTDPQYGITINNTASATAGTVTLDQWQARQAEAEREAAAAEALLDLYEEADAREEEPDP